MELVIEGKAFVNNGFVDCCVGIENGKIVEIKKIIKGEKKICFPGKLVIPGAIDMHVHFRDPGFTYKEDFCSGSMAAVFGGITCVFDMPNNSPPTTSVNSLLDKIEIAARKSYVDYGVYAGINNTNIDRISSLYSKCNGFKVYLGETTNSLLFDMERLGEVFRFLSNKDKPVLFHAEDNKCLNEYRLIRENGLKDHLLSHPSVCEEKAVKTILDLTKNTSSHVHICHVSSSETLELLKNRNRNISFGITPHHALFTIDSKLEPRSFYKVNPPIRGVFDREALFASLANGFADVLESDHAPHTVEDKDKDFNDAACGIPGVETMYPIFLSFVKRDMISINRLIKLISERPSEIMGVKKGRIKTGYDADLLVVDMKKETQVKSNKLHSRCGWSPYESWRAIYPENVFIRGERLIEDYELQGEKGYGRLIGG